MAKLEMFCTSGEFTTFVGEFTSLHSAKFEDKEEQHIE
jgi:hypothetical protein